jgi:hypothetical protein
VTAPVRRAAAPDRAELPVLVMDVHAIGMLGVLRSLGRAGYLTHGCSSDARALGLASRYNRRPAVGPRYSDTEFLSWLRGYVAAQGVRAIVPTEAFLVAIREQIEEFRASLPLLPPIPILYRCFSKYDVLRSFLDAAPGDAVRRHLPPAVLLDSGAAAQNADLSALAAPYWIKADAVHGLAGDRGFVRRAETVEAARRIAGEALATHARILIQGHSRASQQAGVNFLIRDGEALLESMMLSLHDNPHTGGTSGLRRSWWHGAMRDDALARLRHLGWNGVAMLEYKWDPVTDEFEFIEVNTRFWAALHLDLRAGADYPRRLLDCHFGLDDGAPARGANGVVSRWTLPTDWGHMLSKLRDRRLAPWRRLMAPIEFASLCVHSGVRDDFRFPGDSGLYWRQWQRFLGDSLRR